MLHLPDAWVDFECPRCGYSIDIQLVDAKAEATVFCHNCKIPIKLNDQEASVHSGLDQIDAAMRQLKNLFKKFGK